VFSEHQRAPNVYIDYFNFYRSRTIEVSFLAQSIGGGFRETREFLELEADREFLTRDDRDLLWRYCFSAWKLSRTRQHENVRDGRRMILKRCRVTISRVLLVHGPAVCRLTYDRQQLINAFMSIRLAVHHRFKPRPVPGWTHPSTRPTDRPTDRPTNHPSSHPTRATRFPLLSLSLSLSLSLFCTYMYVSRTLRATTQNLRYHHRDASIRLNDRTITPVDVMY